MLYSMLTVPNFLDENVKRESMLQYIFIFNYWKSGYDNPVLSSFNGNHNYT